MDAQHSPLPDVRRTPPALVMASRLSMRNIIRRRAPSDLSRHVTIRSARDRHRMVRRLAYELEQLANRIDQPYVTAVQIQLVVQVCRDRSYPSWKEAREATWRREGGRFSTRTWPAALRAGHFAAVLLPLRLGHVSTASDHPPLVASPRFTYGRLKSDTGYEDGVLSLVTSWVSEPGFGVTAQLAPPMIEIVYDGRIADRRTHVFGVDWPLPASPDLLSSSRGKSR